MNKSPLFGLAVFGLSLVAAIPFQAQQSLAWGEKVYSRYPLAGYVCNRDKGEKLYRCYSKPGGSQGVNFTIGGRRYSF